MPIAEILDSRQAKLTAQELASLALAADQARRAAERRGEIALAEKYQQDRDDITNFMQSDFSC